MLNLELFPGSPIGDPTVVGDRTSMPKNDNTSGTVNTSHNAGGSAVISTNGVSNVISDEANAGVQIQTAVNLGVSDKLNQLVNAVSAINSRLGVMGN